MTPPTRDTHGVAPGSAPGHRARASRRRARAGRPRGGPVARAGRPLRPRWPRDRGARSRTSRTRGRSPRARSPLPDRARPSDRWPRLAALSDADADPGSRQRSRIAAAGSSATSAAAMSMLSGGRTRTLPSAIQPSPCAAAEPVAIPSPSSSISRRSSQVRASRFAWDPSPEQHGPEREQPSIALTDRQPRRLLDGRLTGQLQQRELAPGSLERARPLPDVEQRGIAGHGCTLRGQLRHRVDGSR